MNEVAGGFLGIPANDFNVHLSSIQSRLSHYPASNPVNERLILVTSDADDIGNQSGLALIKCRLKINDFRKVFYRLCQRFSKFFVTKYKFVILKINC